MNKQALLAALPVRKERRGRIAHAFCRSQVVERCGAIGRAVGLDGRDAYTGWDCIARSRDIRAADRIDVGLIYRRLTGNKEVRIDH